MNREKEYNNLLAELDNTPAALEYAVVRAKARAKKAERIHRFVVVPVSGIAVFFIVFAVMVNVSVTFAIACGQIPLLRELAAAVVFSPSLSAAVENEYVQQIGLEQSENGVTMRVEYVIVDQKQLNIFYTLESQSYVHMNAVPSISNPDGTAFDGFALSSRVFVADELDYFTADFMDGDMPNAVRLTCEVYNSESSARAEPFKVDSYDIYQFVEPEYISTFMFTLNFDPAYMQKGEIIPLNQSFILDGQRLTAETVEIYPTHVRLNLSDHEGNSAWLKSLGLYMENEKGEHFETVSSGISAAGSPDSPMMKSYWLESSFFSASKRLTLYITSAVWLDKDVELIKVDLANCTADILPEGVVFEESVRKANDWTLIFSALKYNGSLQHQLFGNKCFDEEGNEYYYNSALSYDMSPGTPGIFRFRFTLSDYPYDTVCLSPSYSRNVKLETPVVIKVTKATR